MSKKHFKEIALAIAELKLEYGNRIPIEELIGKMSKLCKKFSSSFSAQMFLEAIERK